MEYRIFSKIYVEDYDELFYLNELQVYIGYIIWKLLFAILMIVPVLLIIAYSTLLERKVLSAAQRR